MFLTQLIRYIKRFDLDSSQSNLHKYVGCYEDFNRNNEVQIDDMSFLFSGKCDYKNELYFILLLKINSDVQIFIYTTPTSVSTVIQDGSIIY